jgi:plasmid maintenance system antidote protein VapI
MLEQSSYNVTINDQEIIIKLNRELIDQETLNNLLDYLKLKSIRNKSKLTEDSAQQLSDEIDTKMWQKLQSKLNQE